MLLARAVNAGLESADDGDGPWDRIQKRVTEEHKLLADAMARHGHSAGLTLHEGVIVVDVVFQGRSHDIPGLAAALGAEAEQRARLLSAREREILENHLLNEVAGTLHELITAAEAEVRRMNDELESRPTSTGMKLRLIWQQARDAPDGLDSRPAQAPADHRRVVLRRPRRGGGLPPAAHRRRARGQSRRPDGPRR